MRIEELEGQESLFARDSGSGKTSSGRSAAGEILQRVKNGLGQTFKKSSKRSSKLKNHTFMLLDLRQDAGNILGPCWEYDPVWLGSLGTLNTSECPKDVVESSLWQILLDTVPSRYWLSQKACRGMLRRADCRGKLLPELLEIALSMQGGLIPPGPIPDELKAYHFNQRNEGIDLGDVAGALLATQNLQMQTFVTTPGASPDGLKEPVAFAANQRDEVRDLHGAAGALQAQSMGSPTRTQRNGSCGERSRSEISELSQKCESEGYEACGDAKQQTFVASFSAGAGASAGSIAYNETVSPTLKGSASGNCMPSVLCINDQGGKIMECSEDVTGTLRAQEHRHQPLPWYMKIMALTEDTPAPMMWRPPCQHVTEPEATTFRWCSQKKLSALPAASFPGSGWINSRRMTLPPRKAHGSTKTRQTSSAGRYRNGAMLFVICSAAWSHWNVNGCRATRTAGQMSPALRIRRGIRPWATASPSPVWNT